MSIREDISTGEAYSDWRPAISGFRKENSFAADHNHSTQIDQVLQRLSVSLGQIIRKFDCRKSPTIFPTVIELLESLPLSSSEFSLARNRINNAQRYADSEEPGAAVYELRILHRWLRNCNQ